MLEKLSTRNKSKQHRIPIKINQFYPAHADNEVIRAEALFTKFIAQYNISFSASDEFNKLVKRMFPDSKIAAKYGAGRTKTTMIIREGIAPKLDKDVEEMCKTEPFSLMCDGGSEEGADKNFVILVRVFDEEIKQVATKCVDLPTSNIGTAEKLFATIAETFEKRH